MWISSRGWATWSCVACTMHGNAAFTLCSQSDSILVLVIVEQVCERMGQPEHSLVQ